MLKHFIFSAVLTVDLLASEPPLTFCRELRQALLQPGLKLSSELANGDFVLVGALAEAALIVKNNSDRLRMVPDLSLLDVVDLSLEQKRSVPVMREGALEWREVYVDTATRFQFPEYSGCSFPIVPLHAGEARRFRANYRPRSPWLQAGSISHHFRDEKKSQRVVVRSPIGDTYHEVTALSPTLVDMKRVRWESNSEPARNSSACDAAFVFRVGGSLIVASTYEGIPCSEDEYADEAWLKRRFLQTDGSPNWSSFAYVILKKFDLSQKILFRRNARNPNRWGLEIDGKFSTIEDLWRAYESNEPK